MNAGASGGALISADGSVYGIVSCNAKYELNHKLEQYCSYDA